MSRRDHDIPSWQGWLRSAAHDDGKGPPQWILDRQAEIRRELHVRKKEYNPLIRRGLWEDQVLATYNIGPIDLPVDFGFVSSRWHERRNCVPLACDEETWRFAWEYWKGADSYRGIKAHIEEHGMRRAILAEWFMNYDPDAGRLVHRCFAFRGEALQWPILILRTGNERLMMAWFEWGWKTIPTCIMVKDCGFDPAVSAGIRYLAETAPAWLRKGWRYVNRPVEEKGE